MPIIIIQLMWYITVKIKDSHLNVVLSMECLYIIASLLLMSRLRLTIHEVAMLTSTFGSVYITDF